MATFDLKKQLTIHDRGLLQQLLGSEPSMNAVEWDALPKGDIAPLISAWEAESHTGRPGDERRPSGTFPGSRPAHRAAQLPAESSEPTPAPFANFALPGADGRGKETEKQTNESFLRAGRKPEGHANKTHLPAGVPRTEIAGVLRLGPSRDTGSSNVSRDCRVITLRVGIADSSIRPR